MSSSASDTSDRSSSSPEPEVPIAANVKGKAKAKGPRNEGTEPTWAFKPPPGRVLLDEDSLGDAGEFDWDAVNSNEDVELWVIRVPDAIKPKHLQNLKIDLPSSSKTHKVGSLTKKHATFDIWSLGPDDESQGNNNIPAGGEELKNLSLLLPRKKKKGKVYAAPKPIARHLIFAAQPVKPASPPPESLPTQDATTKKFKNPPRPCYPDELLTHSFKPYGSYTALDASSESPSGKEAAEDTMDIDAPASTQPAATRDSAETDKKPKDKSKSKKRKVASDETAEEPIPKKKSKKSKSSS